MYLVVALVVFALMTKFTPGNFNGTVMLSLVWPVLIPAGIYFTVKKFVFKLHGPSPRYFELEALGILAATAIGLVVLYWPRLGLG